MLATHLHFKIYIFNINSDDLIFFSLFPCTDIKDNKIDSLKLQVPFMIQLYPAIDTVKKCYNYLNSNVCISYILGETVQKIVLCWSMFSFLFYSFFSLANFSCEMK